MYIYIYNLYINKYSCIIWILLALTETFVTTLVSISGLVACSLLSVCLVPHRPRSHLGNLKESCWSRCSEKSWSSWLVRTSTVYFIEQCQTYVYNHTPSQTLKPLDYNTSYSLESQSGPGKRSFPSRKTNIHLHQEAWRQGWKWIGASRQLSVSPQNASTSTCWKDYEKKTVKKKSISSFS